MFGNRKGDDFMKKREKGLMILFVLTIVCVVCFAVHKKSSVSEVQEQSGVQEKNTISVAQEKSGISEVQEKNSIPDTNRREDNWQNHLGKLDEDAKNPEQSKTMIQMQLLFLQKIVNIQFL